jgi:hypothetical protein
MAMSRHSLPRPHPQAQQTPREIMPTLNTTLRLNAAEDPIARDRSGSASAMAELFGPLDRLLSGGGDARLAINPASDANRYGCQPFACPETLSFASSTATSISERAYDRASDARQSLMQSAIAVGFDAAFDARIEAMRDELKACLGLSETKVKIVFSPSGTDSQLQALLLAGVLLGPLLTTIIVAADQTGSGTADTARGHHFSAATAQGYQVRKGEPVAGLAHSVASVALPSFDETGGFRPLTDGDARVLGAIEQSVANGTNVLLQIMDSSKLGWRSPSDQCLDEISARWPDRVQVVVDACQMRLGRPRLQNYLDRGYIVIVTGSKFFTGPPFCGALLVPAGLSKSLGAVTEVASGFCEYFSRSDWPKNWSALRSCFPIRANLGQWLRWEAALEEIRAYYGVPDQFRLTALTMFGKGVQRIIASSPSLRLLPLQQRREDGNVNDEELAQTTIFPFLVRREGRFFSLGDCRTIYRALGRDLRNSVSANKHRPEIAAKLCLVGQPVAVGHFAALRICASARLVTETWSSDQQAAHENLRRELGRVGTIVSKIEWLIAHMGGLNLTESCHEA